MHIFPSDPHEDTVASKRLQEVMDDLRKARARAWLEHRCISCHEPVGPDSFKDRLSEREYTISGLCQPCQDKVFEVPEGA